MSLSKFEERLDKLEAVSNYEIVVNENRSLIEDNMKLGFELQKERQKHTEEIKKLKKRIAIFESLKRKYGKVEYDLQGFDALVKKRVDEWKKNEMEKEVERQWRIKAPSLLEDQLKVEFQAYPEGCLKKTKELVESTAVAKMNSLLRDKSSWPKWFNIQITQEVQRRTSQSIDDTFRSMVETEAKKRLQQLIHVEWPRFFKEKIIPFCRSSLRTQLTSMQVPVTIQCDKCGMIIEKTLTSDNIADLIRRPRITIPCSNPNCKDLWWPHHIPINLGDIIYTIITQPTYYARKSRT